MSDRPQPILTRGMILAIGLAIAGAVVIGFVFVPLISPGTDPVSAVLGALGFMLVTMIAGQMVRRE